MTKSVAIFGCGPAGLMAAHAAQLSGWDFRVYSRKVKSKLYGSQYLHAAIPGLDTGCPKVVSYKLSGTPEQYRHKVYGESWDGTVSPEDLMEEHHAWDIRAAYERLWFLYEPEIRPIEINWSAAGGLSRHLFGNYGADLVISTVPRKIWAQPGDVFESTKIWALGDTELPRVEKPYRPEPFTVACDGRPDIPWYRVSNIFGYCTMEWPYIHPGTVVEGPGISQWCPAHGASLVEKPLRHNSTAASDFVHLGRYGAWEKGILTSDVFYQAMKVFAKDSIDANLH